MASDRVGSEEQMAKEAPEAVSGEDDEQPEASERGPVTCSVCGTKLSSYNPGPNCWQHTIGYPWRGPSAKPRYD